MTEIMKSAGLLLVLLNPFLVIIYRVEVIMIMQGIRAWVGQF